MGSWKRTTPGPTSVNSSVAGSCSCLWYDGMPGTLLDQPVKNPRGCRHDPTEEADMRISTQLAYAGDVRAAAEQVVSLEGAGLDLVWVAEAYGFDAVSMLGYLAARTTSVELGSAPCPSTAGPPTLSPRPPRGPTTRPAARCFWALGPPAP